MALIRVPIEHMFVQWRGSIYKAIAFIFSRIGIVRVFTSFVNRFKCKRDEKGELRFPFVARRACGNVQILIYHRVNDDRDAFFPGVSIDAFTKEMEYLVRHYSVLALEDAVDGLQSRDLPDKAVVVTFDDGYRDNYLNAFPILKRLSIPATIFLATDAISSGRMLWHDRVFTAFRKTNAPILEGLGRTDLPRYSLTTLEEKLLAQRAVLKLLRCVDEGERSRLIDRLISTLGVEDRKEDRGLMLDWDEIKEMHDSGISFGSHTVTHPILSTLSIDRTKMEVYGSKKTIEEKLGIPAKAFAYPNGGRGDFNEDIKTLVRRAGYVCGLTTLFGANSAGQDLFELRRATPWDEEISSFGLRLAYYKFCD